MINNPFSLFTQFQNKLSVALFTKDDNITSDEQIASALGIKEVCSLWQVHGNLTIKVDSPTSRTEQADGIVTDKPNLILSIRAADCQPILAYAPDNNVVGVLHAGWRGLIAGAIPGFYKVLKNEFGIEPSRTYVVIGPSLCQKCAVFSDSANELPNIDPKFINDKNCVDLQGAADNQFFELGVPKDQLQRHPDCTACNHDKYWTYRGGDKEAVKEGHTNVLACFLR